jgi:hypothetical protein
MMTGRNSRKNEAAVGYDSDRKHLTGQVLRPNLSQLACSRLFAAAIGKWTS